MSKLYEILKQIEGRKEGSFSYEKFSERVSPESRKKVAILIGILVLSVILGFGSFYVFKSFFFPEVYIPQRSIVRKSPPPAPKVVQESKVQESKVEVKPPVKSPKVEASPKSKGAALQASNLPEKVVVLATSNEKQTKRDIVRKPLKEAAKGAFSERSYEIKKEPAKPPLPLGPEERLRGLLVRAESLRKKGRCSEALRLYREYLKLRKSAEVLNNYAACLFLVGDLEEAETALRESLKLVDDPLTRLNLVMVEIKKGDYSEACLEFKKIDSISGSLYRNLAQFLKTRCR